MFSVTPKTWRAPWAFQEQEPEGGVSWEWVLVVGKLLVQEDLCWQWWEGFTHQASYLSTVNSYFLCREKEKPHAEGAERSCHPAHQPQVKLWGGCAGSTVWYGKIWEMSACSNLRVWVTCMWKPQPCRQDAFLLLTWGNPPCVWFGAVQGRGSVCDKGSRLCSLGPDFRIAWHQLS